MADLKSWNLWHGCRKYGEGPMGYAVYKAEDFIATVADRIRGKYNFGYKRNAARLAKEILTLPVGDDNEIDWDYMENYMKAKEQKAIPCYLHQIQNRHRP